MITLFKSIADKIPARLNIGIMSFLVCFIAYVFRSNLSITIVPMIIDRNSTDPAYGPQYDWGNSGKGILNGGFFWGSFAGTIPAGFLAERYGGKTLTTIGLFISALFTALTPIMCDMSFWAFFANRVIIGLAGGIFYPALHNVVSKWAPPHEKGKFVAALLGGNLGTVVTFQLGSIVMVQYGWVWLYYGIAAISCVIMLAWMLLVANQPSQHPRISREELEYIDHHLGGNVSKKKSTPPYGKMLTSIPFLALIVLHYGSLWGLFFLLTAAPEFMKKVLLFDLTNSGFMASLPHLARFLAGFVFGYIGDKIRQHQWMTPIAVRKVFCIFSHVIPGVLLISIIFVGTEGEYAAYACVGIITGSLGANGAAAITNLQNSQDLAPNYAGTLYSVMNFIGTSSGFISPLVVSYFTQDTNPENPMDGWNIVLIIGGVIYIVPALLFWIFGSADIQQWNEISDTSDTAAIDTESAIDNRTEEAN